MSIKYTSMYLTIVRYVESNIDNYSGFDNLMFSSYYAALIRRLFRLNPLTLLLPANILVVEKMVTLPLCCYVGNWPNVALWFLVSALFFLLMQDKSCFQLYACLLFVCAYCRYEYCIRSMRDKKGVAGQATPSVSRGGRFFLSWLTQLTNVGGLSREWVSRMEIWDE